MKLSIKLAVTALAAAGLLAPGSAMAGKSHLVKLYKIEQHVDLEGQDDTYNVACVGTDIAMDGMWRVDDVEQDNDFVWTPTTGNSQFDVLRAVRAVEVRPNGDSSYDFRFTPESGGDVSMKLFVTCLGRKTESIQGHTHDFQLDSSASSTITDPVFTYTSTPDCDANEILVRPGFRVNVGDADLMVSRPVNRSHQAWHWRWENASPGFSATQYWSCLRMRSDVTNAHRHRLVKLFQTNDSTAPFNSTKDSSPPLVKKNAAAEVQLHCGEHYKGLVGGWDVFNVPGHNFLWYLGMDPRIKTRAFRFINAHTTNDYKAHVYLLCFKDRTT